MVIGLAVMAKGNWPVVPPPGVGLNTVTFAVPTDTMLAAAMEAVSFVLLTKVVVWSEPFQRTFEVLIKFVPFTVSIKAALPAVADVGLILESDGIGLLGGLIVKVNVLDVPPPGVGLKIITFAVPTEAMSEARMDAVSCVSLT